MKKIDKKYLYMGGGLLLVLLVIVFGGKLFKKDENTEEKNIDVKVTIKDDNGQDVVYDPNPLLIRLNKGLINYSFFYHEERCSPIKELYALDAARFMAAVIAYKTKYNETLESHMKGTWFKCYMGDGRNVFDLIHQRITALKDVTTST